jgi:hypothetical protein
VPKQKKGEQEGNRSKDEAALWHVGQTQFQKMGLGRELEKGRIMTKEMAEYLADEFNASVLDLELKSPKAEAHQDIANAWCVQIRQSGWSSQYYWARGLFKEVVRLQRDKIKSRS